MAGHPAPTGEDPSFAELLAVRAHLSMHAMDGLMMEDVPLSRIADELGTPAFVYSAAAMRGRYRGLDGALRDAGLQASIHYAVKANDNIAVLALFAREGAGADVVSEGELRRALAAGVPAERIVFSGVGKTPVEMGCALAAGIRQMNVESAEELDMLSALAVSMGRTARVALRINPDVDAGTHEKITTGRADNKFGIPFADAALLYERASRLPGIEPVGIAVHIGSQITSVAPYREAYARVAELVRDLQARGLRVQCVDCGGGIGIAYRDEVAISSAAFASAIRETLGGLGLPVMVEPGRFLVGKAGVLLARVTLSKTTYNHRYTILDAGMNDLQRPAMYGAWHGILPLSAAQYTAELSPAHVVGPICESSDTFTRNRMLPPLPVGERVAILDAGAYGASMGSTYNSRPMAVEVMVDGAQYAVIRARQPLEALWKDEILPPWL